MDTIHGLYEIIRKRKSEGGEGSYTAYLFNEGLDKILKKIGEESAETVIASKNLEAALLGGGSFSAERDDLKNEICDLLYHLLVLMAEQNVSVDEVLTVLEDRRQKTGNLKPRKVTDKNT